MVSGEKGHVRAIIPKLCKTYGKILSRTDKNDAYAEAELIAIT
jgi:hypothetical protein